MLRRFRDYGARSGTGSSAEAGGYKYDVRAFKRFGDFGTVFLRRLPAEIRIHPGAQTPGQILAYIYFFPDIHMVQILVVGVYGDKFHAPDKIPVHT